MNNNESKQAKLSKILREYFKIKVDQPGWFSVIEIDNVYGNVVLEYSEFTFGDYQIQNLFKAKSESGASGFYMTPRSERSSDARHCVTFYF